MKILKICISRLFSFSLLWQKPFTRDKSHFFALFQPNSLLCKHGPGVGHKFRKKKITGYLNWEKKKSLHGSVKTCFSFILIWAAMWIGINSFEFFSMYHITQIQSEEFWCAGKGSDLSIWETQAFLVLVKPPTWWVSMSNSINFARLVFRSGKPRIWRRPVGLKLWSLVQCVSITWELTKNANLRAYSGPIKPETLWVGCRNHYFNKWSGFFWSLHKFENHWAR